jgi:CheY-like chemotaxis protein
MKVLLAARDSRRLAEFAAGLERIGGAPTILASSGAEAIARAGETSLDLAVIADDLADMTAFTLAARLMTIDAMINTAVLTDMDEKEFHDAGEGLGILARLPSTPGSNDARMLHERLTTMRGS